MSRRRIAARAELVAFRIVVAVLSLVPIGAGLAGASLGCAMVGHALPDDPALCSHVRYLSGLLLAIGVGFLSTVGAPTRAGPRFRLLTAIVVTGGLARLAGVIVSGWPPAAMRAALVMELVVTPALCLWQARLARRASGLA